jgi:hypothetical protein
MSGKGKLCDPATKTIAFNKGSFLKPNTVAFQKFESIPGRGVIPPELQALIPENFVLPAQSHTAVPTHNLVTYSGVGPENSKTSSNIVWDSPVLVLPGLMSFGGRIFERTGFKTRSGENCELMVEGYHQSFTTPNPDKSYTSADFVLLSNPLPKLINQLVTYFSIDGVVKEVISYKYDVGSGKCSIKYKK